MKNKNKIIVKLKKLDWLNYFFELTIVFLGISLAFYINKNAEINTTKKIEKEYLYAIKNDLLDDIKKDPLTIVYFKNELADFITVRDLIVQNKTQHIDTISKICLQLSKETKYHPIINTYQLLINNGEILKITDLKLKKQLAQYYAYKNNLNIHHEDVNRVRKEELSPLISDNYNMYKKFVLNESEFFGDKIQNVLYRLRETLVNRILAYDKALKMCNELIIEIERN
jgi:hypothetical protein